MKLIATAAHSGWWFRVVAPHPGSGHDDFGWGVVHGLTAPLNFFYQWLGDSRVQLFQTPNSGAGYSFGFLLGLFFLVCLLAFVVSRLCR